MNGSGLRMHVEKLPILGDRIFQIARLLLLDCVLNKFLKLLRSLCLCNVARVKTMRRSAGFHMRQLVHIQFTRKNGTAKAIPFSVAK